LKDRIYRLKEKSFLGRNTRSHEQTHYYFLFGLWLFYLLLYLGVLHPDDKTLRNKLLNYKS
ncbi:MAG: hypothetical protein KJO93_09655, partial [Muriicola sp.]|nr:hypothetical protein [Muriicola sp.]